MQSNRLNSYVLVEDAFQFLGVTERITFSMHVEVQFPSSVFVLQCQTSWKEAVTGRVPLAAYCICYDEMPGRHEVGIGLSSRLSFFVLSSGRKNILVIQKMELRNWVLMLFESNLAFRLLQNHKAKEKAM